MTRFSRAFVAAALLVSCAGYLRQGQDLYSDGRYIEAADLFDRTEERLAREDAERLAEYGLYRGATLLALGDFRAAHRWLAYAYEVEASHPGSLSPMDRGRLDRVWYDLYAAAAGREPPATTPPVGPANAATPEAPANSPGQPAYAAAIPAATAVAPPSPTPLAEPGVPEGGSDE